MKRMVCLMALATVSCSNFQGGNPRICGSIGPRVQGPVKTANDQRQIMVSCIDHWSRRLAKSERDSAYEVADAALGACWDAIETYVSMADVEKTPTDGVEAIATNWRRHAIFVAVQTRAGNCPLPPES